MAHYTSLASLKLYGGVTEDTLDSVLGNEIEWAEDELAHHAGCDFYQQTVLLEQCPRPFIDGAGWLWLTAIKVAPVTAVTAIQIRDIGRGSRAWMPLVYTADDIITPVMSPDGVTPDSWTVRVYPSSPVLGARSTGQILVRWSYVGGYAGNAIPPGLETIVNRLAWWHFKLREAPFGRISVGEMGIVIQPQGVPPDLVSAMDHWRRVV
jgi:hypothetical protein